MRRTAQFIEELKAVTPGPRAKLKGKPRGKPFSKGHDVGKETRFQPGESGNPSGLPGTDVAAVLARKFLSQFDSLEDMASSLKGFNAYAFGVVADRAYGKVAEKRINEITGKDGGPVEITIKFVKPDA